MFIKPMLAATMSDSKRKKVSYQEGYDLEVKHDGMRSVSLTGAHPAVYSRTGFEYTEHIPNLVNQLKSLPDDTVIDGELMVMKDLVNVNGKEVPIPNFNQTMRIMGSNPDVAVEKQNGVEVNYYLYDILRLRGEDLTQKPFSERAEILRNEVAEKGNLFVAPAWGAWTEEDLTALVDAGLEGGILKNRDSLYYPGKRKANTWYKFKAVSTAEVVVVGFTDANEGKTGKFAGQIGAIKFGVYNNGVLEELGQCSGMSDRERKYWTDLRDQGGWENKVIEIKFNELIGDGTPRHPQYVTERVDKTPEECTREQFKS